MKVALSTPATGPFHVTVDAETDVIREGARAISAVRDDVARAFGIRVPITWFVRFQRTWTVSVAHDTAEAYRQAPDALFDGFALLGDELRDWRARGDEIGWHYHAYHYVERPELDHATRLAILEADLRGCHQALGDRHPDLAVTAFRFGWFFVPDYRIFETLWDLGVRHDASFDPARRGAVKGFDAHYLPPPAIEGGRVGPMACAPFAQTLLVHDWEVVAHDLGWSRASESDAAAGRARLRQMLTDAATAIRAGGGRFATYARASGEEAAS